MAALRSRSMVARLSAVAVAAALVGVGVSRPGISPAEPAVAQFLLAWQSRHYLQAARMTTGQPAVVAAALSGAYRRLDASRVQLSMSGISQRGRQAEASFQAAIDLSGNGLLWTYTGGFDLTDGAHGWRVAWSPSVIVPGMTSTEQLAVVSRFYPRAQVLDSAGKSLISPAQVTQVGVVPGQLADPARTAQVLSQVTQIPAEQIEGQIEQNPQDDFLSLLTYTPAAYAGLRAGLSAVPGLQVREATEPLFQTIAPDVVGTVGTESASILRTEGVEYRPGTTVGLTGLESAYQRQLVGTPRTDVVLEQSGSAAVDLHTWPGAPGQSVRTTLNGGVQLAANQALASSPGGAAIVAVQASTGKILAVASRAAGGMPAPDPLAGRYEPGQAFTIVSAAALLSTGRLKPGDPVPCPPSNSVDGTVFTNDPPEPDLGSTPSFQADFSHACATAFAGGLSMSLGQGGLQRAESSFGIGGWELPDARYFDGQTGPSADQGALAADLIGTGGVRVSPLGMALAAGVVDSGHFHAPSLVDGMDGSSTASQPGLSARVLAELRTMMAASAATGANRAADVGGKVFGQAGSAPFGTSKLRSNWFVGYRGDVAFAVVQLSSSGGGAASAAPLTASFVQDLPAGS